MIRRTQNLSVENQTCNSPLLAALAGLALLGAPRRGEYGA